MLERASDGYLAGAGPTSIVISWCRRPSAVRRHRCCVRYASIPFVSPVLVADLSHVSFVRGCAPGDRSCTARAAPVEHPGAADGARRREI